MKLLGMGDNVMDAYLFRGELYPGGNAANVSVLAKRAGASQSGYIGILADDTAGEHFLNALHQERVDVARLRRGMGKTACNYIRLDEAGDRVFSGNNGQETVQSRFQLALTQADYDYAGAFDVLHTSIHSGLNGVLPALSRRTALSMDFSCDGYTKTLVSDLAPFLRFAFLSSGGRPAGDVQEILHFAAACRIPEVVCTLGLRGACGISSGRYWEAPAYPSPEAMDALGAGDAFIAAFLVRWYENGGDAAAAADDAAHFAAKCCTHHGAFGHPLPVAESGLELA